MPLRFLRRFGSTLISYLEAAEVSVNSVSETLLRQQEFSWNLEGQLVLCGRSASSVP